MGAGELLIKKSLGREMIREVQALKTSSNDPNTQSVERMTAMVGPIVKYLYFSGSAADLAINDVINSYKYGNKLYVVSQAGGDAYYHTISSALSAATGATLHNPATILILPGKYNETLTIKDNVNLIGIDPVSCILTSNSGIPISATNKQEVRVENMSIYQTGTSSAINVEGGASINTLFTFKNCIISAKSPTNGTIYANGGGVNLYDSVVYSSGSYGVNMIGNGGLGYPYSKLFIKDTYISGSTAAFFHNNSNVNTNVYIQNSYLYAGAGPAIWYTPDGNVNIASCRLQSNLREAIKVGSGTTASNFIVNSSNVISVSGSTTNLVGLISGAGTIGFYNNLINNDNKPASLVANANHHSFFYGETNCVSGLQNYLYWDDIKVPMNSIKKGTISPPTTDTFLSVLLIEWFAANALEQVFFDVQLPHGYKEGTDIRAHVHWTPSSTNTGVVNWLLDYSWTNIDGTFAPVSTVAMPATGGGVLNVHQMSSIVVIPGTGKKISSMLVCRLYRNGGVGADTFTGLAGLLEADFHYQIESPGSLTPGHK